MNVCFFHIARLLLGLVFVFSGFVKVIDPFGFTLKTEAYLQAWDMIPLNVGIGIAILLPAIELWLGIMLILGIWKRWVTVGIACMIVGFTILTAYLAFGTYVGIHECGCFGDAIIINNEKGFYKNLIILLFALYCVYCAWKEQKVNKILYPKLVAVYFLLLVVVIPICSLIFLPPFDFLDYNRGTNLRENSAFHVYNAEYKEVTESILDTTSLPLFIVVKNEELTVEETKNLEPLMEMDQEGKIGLVMMGDYEIPSPGKFYINSVTAKSLIRAKSGVVLLQEGVIRGKWKLTGLTTFYLKNNKDIEEIIKDQSGIVFQFWLLLFFAVIIGLFLTMPWCWNK